MRIHIFGIYGAGKSTLARKLSKILKINHYELDDLKYKVKYSQTRAVIQRIKMLHKICQRKNWITEGAWTTYAEEAFKKADILIMMSNSPIKSIYRVLKRYFTKKEYCKEDSLFKQFTLIKNIFKYHLTKDIMSKHTHKELIKKYGKRVFIIRTNKDSRELIKILNSEKF